MVLPEDCFVRTTITQLPENHDQDETRLRPWVDPHKLKMIDGIWYRQGARVIMGGLDDIRTIIKNHHDPPTYGHPGITQTTHIIEQHYWWPHMLKHVPKY